MKILVSGGRHFGEFSYNKFNKQENKWETIYRDRDQALAEKWTVYYVLGLSGATHIVQGNAKGADSQAQAWADKYNVTHSGSKYTAEWDKYDKEAGHIRNTLMLDDNPDIECVYAFEGGYGTANMVMQAKERGISVVEPKIILSN